MARFQVKYVSPASPDMEAFESEDYLLQDEWFIFYNNPGQSGVVEQARIRAKDVKRIDRVG